MSAIKTMLNNTFVPLFQHELVHVDKTESHVEWVPIISAVMTSTMSQLLTEDSSDMDELTFVDVITDERYPFHMTLGVVNMIKFMLRELVSMCKRFARRGQMCL